MKVTSNPQTTYMGIFSFDSLKSSADSYTASSTHSAAIVHTIVDWATPASNGSGSPSLATFADQNGSIGGSVLGIASTLAAQNSVLAVSWDPLGIDYADPGYYYGTKTPEISLQDILDGTYDAYIQTVAQQVAGLNAPIMMNMFGEANSAALFGYGANGTSFVETVDDRTGAYGDPTLPDGPERVRDVFRHIIDIFKAEGASNATWFMYMWSGYMTDPDSIAPSNFYPGDAYIDWVGQSLYVDSASEIDGSLQAGYQAWAQVSANPFFIPELGRSNPGGAEVSAILNGLSAYDNLGAITWADSDVSASDYGIPRLGTVSAEWTALQNAPGYADSVQIDGSTA